MAAGNHLDGKGSEQVVVGDRAAVAPVENANLHKVANLANPASNDAVASMRADGADSARLTLAQSFGTPTIAGLNDNLVDGKPPTGDNAANETADNLFTAQRTVRVASIAGNDTIRSSTATGNDAEDEAQSQLLRMSA